MDKDFIFSTKKTVICSHCQSSLVLQVDFQSTAEKTVLTLESEKTETRSFPTVSPLDNKKVVVAVEGEGTLEWIKEILEEAHFEVIEAVSAEDIFFAMGNDFPATVLVDFSRLAFLNRIQNKSVVIVISSGSGQRGLYSSAHASLLDADDYVEKRFIQRDLIEKIKFHLSRRQGPVIEIPSMPEAVTQSHEAMPKTETLPLEESSPAPSFETVVVEAMEPVAEGGAWSEETGGSPTDYVGSVTAEPAVIAEESVTDRPLPEEVEPASDFPVSEWGSAPAAFLEEKMPSASVVEASPWGVSIERDEPALPERVEEPEPVVGVSEYTGSAEPDSDTMDQIDVGTEASGVSALPEEIESVPDLPIRAWGSLPDTFHEEEEPTAPGVELSPGGVSTEEEEPVPSPVVVEEIEPVANVGGYGWGEETDGGTRDQVGFMTEDQEAVTEASVTEVLELPETVEPASDLSVSEWGSVETLDVSLDEERPRVPVVESSPWGISEEEEEPVPSPAVVDMETLVETDPQVSDGESSGVLTNQDEWDTPVQEMVTEESVEVAALPEVVEPVLLVRNEDFETPAVSLKEEQTPVLDVPTVLESQSLEGLEPVLSEGNGGSEVNFSEWSQSVLQGIEPPVAIPLVDPKEIEMAKRLARIIVSDIVLYNENKVMEGIRKGTFYTILQEDIDEGRKHYNSRVSLVIRQQSDYLAEAFEAFIKRKQVNFEAP